MIVILIKPNHTSRHQKPAKGNGVCKDNHDPMGNMEEPIMPLIELDPEDAKKAQRLKWCQWYQWFNTTYACIHQGTDWKS